MERDREREKEKEKEKEEGDGEGERNGKVNRKGLQRLQIFSKQIRLTRSSQRLSVKSYCHFNCVSFPFFFFNWKKESTATHSMCLINLIFQISLSRE